MRRFFRVSVMVLAGAWSIGAVAQQYPVKPVRLLVGIAPGGGLDTGTRTVANKLSELLGQTFIVENRPGGGGTIAAAAVANAAPDGYTLLMAATTIMVHPAVYANLPYDPIKSFTPIGAAGTEILVITVHPSVPAKNTAELIALLKAHPGKFSYGSPGVGTVHHLAMEMFKKQAGVDIVHIPYKGAALITPDLISGQIPMAIMSVNTTVPQVKGGKIRAIAISSPVKLAVADWPSIGETLPGFDAASTRLLMAPAGLSREIVLRLSDSLRRMLASEDIQRAFTAQGSHWQFVSPDDLANSMRTDVVKWSTAAREAGVKPE
jgi:tripartite-type tricarboxylate transporter receptor subunit TctC